MKYILDTNTLSELDKKHSQAHFNIKNRLAALSEEDMVYYSILSIYEMEHGVSWAKERAKDPDTPEKMKRTKLAMVRLGEWYQQNQKGFAKAEAFTSNDISSGHLRDFFKACKLIRDYESHETPSANPLFEALQPAFLYKVLEYARNVEIDKILKEEFPNLIPTILEDSRDKEISSNVFAPNP